MNIFNIKKLFRKSMNNDCKIYTLTSLFFLSLSVFSSNVYASSIIGETITDKKFEIAEYGKSYDTIYNGKTTLLVLWTTWCPNCLSEIPKLNRLQNYFGDKLDIVGVEVDSEKSIVLSSIESNHVAFRSLLDKDNYIVNTYGLRRAVPQIIIINKDGIAVKELLGPVNVESDSFKGYLNFLIED